MKNLVKALILPAAVIFFAASCGQSQSKDAKIPEQTKATEQAADSVKADDRGYIVKVGDMVPQFDLHLLDGSKVPVSTGTHTNSFPSSLFFITA